MIYGLLYFSAYKIETIIFNQNVTYSDTKIKFYFWVTE